MDNHCDGCGAWLPAFRPPSGTGAAGYVSYPHGWRHCYPCADATQREELKHESRLFAYLDREGNKVTTWTGGLLARVESRTEREVGFGEFGGLGRRIYIRAVDVHGARWYGSGPSAWDYVRLRKAKARTVRVSTLAGGK